MRLTIYGLETEEDLEALSFTMTDGAGEVMAKSTGGYKDYKFYTSGNARYCEVYTNLISTSWSIRSIWTTRAAAVQM